MSSMLLLKDHDLGKKAEVISTPFHVGKQLIAAKIARYADASRNSVEAQAEPLVEHSVEKPTIAGMPPSGQQQNRK